MASDTSDNGVNIIILLPFIMIFSALGVYMTLILVRAICACLKEGNPAHKFFFGEKLDDYKQPSESNRNQWLDTRSELESVSPALIWSPERTQWERNSTPDRYSGVPGTVYTPSRTNQSQQKSPLQFRDAKVNSKVPTTPQRSPNFAYSPMGMNINMPPMSTTSPPRQQQSSVPTSPIPISKRPRISPPPMPKPPSQSIMNTIPTNRNTSNNYNNAGTNQAKGYQPQNVHDNILHRGVLHRKTTGFAWKSSWIPRNCILYESGLFTCLGRGGSIKLQIEVSNCVIRYIKRLNNKSFVFTLTPRNSLDASRDQVVFAAPSLLAAEEWQHCFHLLSVDQAQ